MGSLALVFGLLFFIGLIGAAFKTVARRDGALPWFACACAGLLLYVSLLVFAANQNGPGRNTVPAGHAAHTNSNTQAVTREKSPPNSSSVAPGPGVTSRTYTVPATARPLPAGKPSGSVVKSVYGSGTAAP